MKEKLVKILQMDVKVRSSHLWMVYLGVVVGLGFLINCGIAPFVPECTPIDYEELILTASIIAGLGTARQLVLYKFKYLEDLSANTKAEATAEEILRERLWVPCVGWFLVIGFAVNMLVLPFFHEVRQVDWSFLQASIAIFLTISGAREVGIYAQQGQKSKNSLESTEQDSEE